MALALRAVAAPRAGLGPPAILEIGGVAIAWIVAAVLFAFADLILARLDARRNRGWLVAGPILFALLVLSPYLGGPLAEAWSVNAAALAANAAAAGLIWWALLPTDSARARDVWRIFG